MDAGSSARTTRARRPIRGNPAAHWLRPLVLVAVGALAGIPAGLWSPLPVIVLGFVLTGITVLAIDGGRDRPHCG